MRQLPASEPPRDDRLVSRARSQVFPVTDQQLAPVVPIGQAQGRSVPRLAFSPDEVAESLGVSRDLVDQLVRTGRLHSVKAGHRRLIGLHAIEAFLTGEDAG